MTYPQSDHYDGEIFFNPEGTTSLVVPPDAHKRRRGGFIRMLRYRFIEGNYAKWPSHIPNKPWPFPAGPINDGEVSVSFIGHASFLIRLPGLTILTDPVFSARCSPVQWAGPKRARAPGIKLADLPKPDLILLSHNHYDHMDLLSLRALAKRFGRIPIITMLGNRDYLASNGIHGATELDWWQHHSHGEAHITITPSRHFAARGLNDRNHALWGGFMLVHRGHKIYFAGDTGYTKYFTDIRARCGAPDLAFLPIGAYEPRWFMGPVHMNPQDAVMAFADLGAKQAIGMHFGTFQLTEEAIDAPERDLAIARDKAGMAADQFVTLDFGETRLFNMPAP
jgi:L-ascorbate metabolism protein UlaG (beta-lactamase superfamily)